MPKTLEELLEEFEDGLQNGNLEKHADKVDFIRRVWNASRSAALRHGVSVLPKTTHNRECSCGGSGFSLYDRAVIDAESVLLAEADKCAAL